MALYGRLGLLLLCCCVAGGCRFKGDPAPGGSPNGGGDEPGARWGVRWPFAPTALRIGDYTEVRYDAEAKTWVLEAYLTLLDPAGHPTKSLGRARFELYAVGAGAAAVDGGKRLEVWSTTIDSVDKSTKHYSRFTLCHVFTLRMASKPPAGRRLRLEASFERPNSRRLRTTGWVRVSGEGEPEAKRP